MNVISFSLWGNIERYYLGVYENIRLAKEIFPDYNIILYYDDSVQIDRIKNLENEGVILTNATHIPCNAMMWRFLAADTDGIFLSRDLDSRLDYREKYAVEEWLNGDKDFHIMRDHPQHAVKILGGMWGCRNGILKNIKELVYSFSEIDLNNLYKVQVDQSFLQKVIYPMIKDNCIIHDEFFDKKPFPEKSPKRTNTHFVGQSYDEYNNPVYQ